MEPKKRLSPLKYLVIAAVTGAGSDQTSANVANLALVPASAFDHGTACAAPVDGGPLLVGPLLLVASTPTCALVRQVKRKARYQLGSRQARVGEGSLGKEADWAEPPRVGHRRIYRRLSSLTSGLVWRRWRTGAALLDGNFWSGGPGGACLRRSRLASLTRPTPAPCSMHLLLKPLSPSLSPTRPPAF